MSSTTRIKQVSETTNGKIININSNSDNNQQKAILYIRVSTDEQAEKGYSLKHQEERLKTILPASANWKLLLFTKEDHSAKTLKGQSLQTPGLLKKE